MTARPATFALRPVNAVHQLGGAPEACPLSLREVVRGLGPRAGTVPIVLAPLPAVARGALVAARQAGAVLGLGLLPGVAPEPWFQAVARAADELAPGLPFFAGAEVRVEAGTGGVERAHAQAHRLVDAGITHLAVDVAAIPLARRAQVAAEVAGFAAEREIAVECVLPAAQGGLDPEAAAALVDEFEGWGVRADLASARLPAPRDEREARIQVALLEALSRSLGGRPLVRRGPVSAPLLARLGRGGPRACEDGGATLAAVVRALPPGLREGEASAEGGRRELTLPPAVAERLEALAYAEVGALIDAFGAGGTAAAVEAGLASRS